MSESKSGSNVSTTSNAASNSQPTATEVKPRKLLHESERQYQERKELFEKYRSVYGDDQTESLTVLWSNIKYLGCRYDPKAEARVIPWGGLEDVLREDPHVEEKSMMNLISRYT